MHLTTQQETGIQTGRIESVSLGAPETPHQRQMGNTQVSTLFGTQSSRLVGAEGKRTWNAQHLTATHTINDWLWLFVKQEEESGSEAFPLPLPVHRHNLYVFSCYVPGPDNSQHSPGRTETTMPVTASAPPKSSILLCTGPGDGAEGTNAACMHLSENTTDYSLVEV